MCFCTGARNEGHYPPGLPPLSPDANRSLSLTRQRKNYSFSAHTSTVVWEHMKDKNIYCAFSPFPAKTVWTNAVSLMSLDQGTEFKKFWRGTFPGATHVLFSLIHSQKF
jgi:hypothetical protein